MLNKIIYYSLHNRLVVLVCSLLLMIAGTYTAFHTDVDVFPDLNAPTVVIMTEANGMAPEEVERLVTFPVETAVNGAMDVRRVRSSSTTGFSVVWVEFDWGTDIYRARQIVSEKLAVVNESLPENVGKPTLGPQSSILGEMMIIGLTVDENKRSDSQVVPTTEMDLRTIADWTIRPRLLSTGGVAQVAVIGGDIKEFQILLDPARMKHYGISLSEVLAVTRNMNRNANGGVLYEYDNEYIIRGVLSTSKANEIGKGVIKTANDYPILLEDVATVKIGGKSPKLGTASEKAKPAVLITVTKQPNTSTINLTEQLDGIMADLQKNLPPDVNVSTDIFRQSRFIDSSINNVKDSLLEGSFFVIIVLFLFLMNIRTTVISLVALPLSLLVSILVLHFMGLTINTMSLGGMAIAIGSLVDDAIVDVENVYKRIRENRLLPPEQQRTILEVVFDASREVRMPILNSTLIIVVSFVPLFFLHGMEGRMLIPLGIAFIVALFASTVVALTLTPVLCSYLLKGKTTKSEALQQKNGEASGLKESWVSRNLKKVYKQALLGALAHKGVVLGSTIALFVVALVVFFTLGRSFLPPFNEGSFTINVSSLPGISLEESDKMGRRAEELLMQVPEIQTVARKTGRAELDEHALGVNVSEIEAPFVLKNRSRSAVMNDVREKLSIISGANIEIGQPISHRIDAMLSGTEANIAIKLFGTDLNLMFTVGNQIQTAIQGIPGLVDLKVEQQIERPQLTITPKRELMAKYGISLPEFEEYINVMLGGEVVSQVYDDGKTFDLTVKTSDSSRATMEDIRNLMIDANGKKVPLSYVAEVRSVSGPNTINRENVQRKIVISGNVSERDLRSVVNEIQQKVDASIKLPEGYHIEYGGQFESEAAASRTLLLTSMMSLLVIFLLLYNEFKDAKESGVVLLNLPLALIGGVFILKFTSGEVSIPAIIGFISLFGIATRNGMLLISHYTQLRTVEKMPLRQAVLQGSLDRLNPILMTALSSALALVPLALQGDLPGNEIQSPMATVILGGLLTSTFLNGFIIPIVYLLMNRKEDKLNNNTL
ncbi:efflux RND transporter permease subunit [Parabacteroides sp. AM08-6]|uniref:efflux RND transporter permease subunit n=1 Tax=Parabacteroides sp. AM08-6 TaxID=2292053 RepID=UPI000EFFA356|nr:efflux RND transporter permease subunit [Parabacteroides sp. AM08-6]RHJ83431.1 AcrB/AcrD/AcrF family protein [Parabacteroides sp. AM08-6]